MLTECVDWLDQLGDSEDVRQPRINVRPEDDWPATNVVMVDQDRIVRILRRVAADLEELARARTLSDANFSDRETTAVERLRRRYAEPDIPHPSGPMSVPQGRRAGHDTTKRCDEPDLRHRSTRTGNSAHSHQHDSTTCSAD